MNANVVTATEDQNIMSTCRIMYENYDGDAIIIKLTGNSSSRDRITERDVVRILSRVTPAILQTPLRTVISKPLRTIERSSSINDAIKIYEAQEYSKACGSQRSSQYGWNINTEGCIQGHLQKRSFVYRILR